MRRTFDLSTVLAALGAVLVIVALFLEWYEPGLSAWDVFEVVDWALLALAAGALALVIAETTGAAAPSRRLPWVAGTIAFLVVAEVIDAPPAVAGAERAIGAWLALGGAFLLVAGVALALLQISVRIDVGDRERRRRTAAVDARVAASRARDEGRGRADEPAAAAEDTGGDAGREPRSALWKRPDEGKSKARVEGETSPPAGVSPGPAEDPDRTQPLPAVEPRERDG
ncbi:MAG TPA: hypothetical protein VFR97_11095 [Capillimicrobium sp.]|nr:hypothetical protein [Capillimicrobium sp.]